MVNGESDGRYSFWGHDCCSLFTWAFDWCLYRKQLGELIAFDAKML